MSKTMMLTQNVKESKLAFPIIAARKYDGVPVRIQRDKDGNFFGVTRQDNTLASIDHILQEFQKDKEIQETWDLLTTNFGSTFAVIGEVDIEGEAFKSISGKVRKEAPAPQLRLRMFDIADGGTMPYSARLELLVELDKYLEYSDVQEWKEVLNTVALQDLKDHAINEGWEGIMLRNHEGKYIEGKRSWDMMRWKPEPTIDLEVESFEEATANADKFDPETGEQIEWKGRKLGRVGRINVRYAHTIIGVSAGKMKHKEAKEVWENQDEYIGKICEIKYMKDDTYDALRQPTFQHWRDDKTTPDA